jgi:hypothetical protein
MSAIVSFVGNGLGRNVSVPCDRNPAFIGAKVLLAVSCGNYYTARSSIVFFWKGVISRDMLSGDGMIFRGIPTCRV